MAKNFKELQAKMSPQARARSEAKAERMIQEMALDELRTALDLTQEQLAEVLHVRQAAISKVERRSDMFISTLRKIIEAMGGELEIRAILPGGIVRISQFGELRKPHAAGAVYRAPHIGKAFGRARGRRYKGHGGTGTLACARCARHIKPGYRQSVSRRTVSSKWHCQRRPVSQIPSSPPREFWSAQAPVREDSERVPRVQNLDAEIGEVLHVPRHQRKAVLQRRRGDHAVRGIERSSFQLTLAIQQAPAIGDGERDRQDASAKPGQQLVLKPPLQLGTAPASREKDQPSP